MGTVVPRTVKKLGEITSFFEASISISHSFQILSQFSRIKGCKRCLKILLLSLLPTAELRHQDDSLALPSKRCVLLQS